jgi:ESCRT-I complex subunit VPS28
VKLTDTRAERDLQDSLGELFSIIVTLDELEKAFLKDAIPEAEYTDICERSLRQYKALLADETIANEFKDLEEFKAKWDVSYTNESNYEAEAINLDIHTKARRPPRN